MADNSVPLFEDGRFQNPWGVNNSKGLLNVLKWKMTSSAEAWPKEEIFESRELPAPPTEGAVVTWVNHATFLARMKGMTILIDPVWSKRVSPFSFIGPERVHAPGVSWDKLPSVDLVLVTHNHYDHLDIETLVKLEERDQPLFLVPLGDGKILRDRGIKRVQEVTWFQETKVGETMVTFTPAQHWSARWTWDKNKSLWGGWWIKQDGVSIYHVGDSGYGPHYKTIHEKLGIPSLALIPIGAYEPRWFMKDMHMNPEDAVLAYKDLGKPKSVAMHFGTFPLSDEGMNRPADDLRKELLKEGAADNHFVVPKVGESFIIPI